MEPSEIFEYVYEGVKWLTMGGVTAYVGLLLSSPISDIFSKK